jgi:alanine racemase
MAEDNGPSRLGVDLKSWVEISGARLVENLRAVQSVAAAAAGGPVETLAVVKANGYGHDGALVAEVLAGAGVKWLGVSDVDEGMRVRAALEQSSAGQGAAGQGPVRLLVMCGMEAGDAGAMVSHGLTPVVWTVEHVAAMEKAARAMGSRVSVHVEVDTGMSRQGAVVGAELGRVLARLAESRWVHCEGLMSHLVEAEVAGSAVTAVQRERFGGAVEQVRAAGMRLEWVHLGNTSAVDEGSTMGWVREQARRVGARPMVRAGLAMFGGALEVTGSAKGGLLAARLRPAMVWKTRVIGVREIEAGTTVGYGATFVAPGAMRIALLPVGYADGFRREASSGVGDGWVVIGGKRARVVGRVSMNLVTVDVTGMDVGVGEEVVLLGDGVSAEDHARWCQTIAYEILCEVKGRVELV